MKGNIRKNIERTAEPEDARFLAKPRGLFFHQAARAKKYVAGTKATKNTINVISLLGKRRNNDDTRNNRTAVRNMRFRMTLHLASFAYLIR